MSGRRLGAGPRLGPLLGPLLGPSLRRRMGRRRRPRWRRHLAFPSPATPDLETRRRPWGRWRSSGSRHAEWREPERRWQRWRAVGVGSE